MEDRTAEIRGLETLLAEVADKRRLKAEAEEVLKGLRASLEAVEEELLDLLRTLQIKTVAAQDGTRYSRRVKIRASWADQEEGLTWLRHQGLGSLVRDYVPPQTLEATVRELVEQGVEIPECIRVYEQETLSVTRS